MAALLPDGGWEATLKEGGNIADQSAQDGIDIKVGEILGYRRQLTSEQVSYRTFRKRVKQPWELAAAARHLQDAAADQVECFSEEEIRDYLKNKSIVVLASESFVIEGDPDQKTNQNEVQSYMVPIAEKRLDFRYHKNIVVQIEE